MSTPHRSGDDRGPAAGARADILGLRRVLAMALHQADSAMLTQQLLERIAADDKDAAAMVDISMILQSRLQAEEARALLLEAVKLQRDFRVVHGDGSGITMLVFVTPGDFMANTPVDCLFSGSNAVLWFRYVDGDTTALDDLPEHDVAFFAIGEANRHGPVLARMATLLAGWKSPIMNNDPALIGTLTRDGVSAMFADEPSILVPENRRVARNALAAVAGGGDPEDLLGSPFPLVVRPIGTHAGGGMACVGGAEDVARYLEAEGAARFYAAPFIDYRGADGWFSKQRVVLIDGRPFASHLALSDHWMVHYLNAGMAEDARKRAIEAEWMANFDTGYALRHRAAFEALYARVGLDYFGIDCAELPDGRLLVFELDVAMVVHDLDDPETFPYKQAAMRKLFDAFVASAERRRVEAQSAGDRGREGRASAA